MSGHIVRFMQPNCQRDVFASACQGCGADYPASRKARAKPMTASKSLRSSRRDARVAAWRCLPVLRQALQGRAAGGLGAGIAVGPNLRAFVIYLRSVQGIPWRD